MQDHYFTQFRDLLQIRCGLYFSSDNRADLQDGIRKAMLQAGYHDENDYYYRLVQSSDDDEIWRQLVSYLTIGETYFFRNRWHIQALRDTILPNLIEQRREKKLRILRLWSAGCSTGEEAYSLAILLRELLYDIDRWHISILATDINFQSLARAERGIYGEWSFRIETPEHIRKRYFTKRDTLYHINPEVQRMIRFRYLNLVEGNYPALENDTGSMDIILCRNVTIYFDRETTRKIADRFYEALVAGGWLIVGHSEPLTSVYTRYETHNFPNAVLYRKAVPIKRATGILSRDALKPMKLPEPLDANPMVRVEQLIERNKVEDAKDVLEDTLQVNPNDAEALYILAKLNADEGQHKKVHDILDTIEQNHPLLPQAHLLRGLVFQAEQAFSEAKAALRRAIYADRNLAIAHYYMGEIHLAEGRTNLARRSWQNAYDLLLSEGVNKMVPFGDGVTVGTLQHAIEQRMKRL